MTGILYLHGANMTERSFALFRKTLRNKSFCPEYTHEDGLANNIERLQSESEIHFKNKAVDIVAHSMGGLIALALLRNGFPIRRIITMSTPFGGSIAAGNLKWMYPCQLFNDIDSNNRLIYDLKNQEITVPMKSFVTVGGNSPLKLSKNDGVVSVKSQYDLNGPDFEEVDVNHYEILLCQEIIDKTKKFLT